MSRSRLEDRLGAVIHLGRGTLHDHAHAFSHRGQDGTGKGNIFVAPGELVHGVVYELTLGQFESLHPFEGGYQFIEVTTTLVHSGELVTCCTYMDLRPPCSVPPHEEYLSHYRQGFKENQIPEDYVARVWRQAGR